MDADELTQQIGQVCVVDVRESDEWEAGHLPDAIHLPLGSLSEQFDAVPSDVDVVAVCRTGRRSARAVEMLRKHGRRAENLDGGLIAWAEAGNSLVDYRGQPGFVLPPEEDRDDLPEDLAQTRDNFLEVIFGLQERYGNREPTDEEAREFMREWLTKKGRSPEEIERILSNE